MDLWIPFYDQISDYFSTYFWLYHPGDPDHSALNLREFVCNSRNLDPRREWWGRNRNLQVPKREANRPEPA